jgi:CHAT domain-containing protein
MQKAGAKAAIASLWQVDDSGTQSLMNAFYSGLQQGQSKAKSLQQAQQTLINSGDSQRNHPYYWAPFILIGNGL